MRPPPSPALPISSATNGRPRPPSGCRTTPCPRRASRFCNPDLAATWERSCAEVAGTTGREAQIDAARKVFSQGFIAQAIDDWMRDAHVMDASGARHKGVLTGQDMAGWSASYEPALTVRHAGWQVYKGGFWSQGPVLLQVLQTLAADPLAAMDPTGPQFVHLVTEALKLAFADREAHYGDPADAEIPAEILLSRAHGSERRAPITERAWTSCAPRCCTGSKGRPMLPSSASAGWPSGPTTPARGSASRRWAT
ncbi:gamma-glutamyltransferase [Novosphingobium sp. MW5]|nr:gamma-glutamyltransferase [Novosphingobium sp. MW5]